MEIGKLPMAIVSITIAVIVCAMVLIPVVQDATAETDTFVNDGYFHLQKFTSDDEYIFSWDATAPGTITINGVEMTTPNETKNLSLVLGEKFYLRYPGTHTRMSYYSGGNYVNTSESYPTISFTYSGGTVTCTNGSTSRTLNNVSEIYGIMPTGDYVMKVSESIAYLNSGSEIIADSEIYATGQTYSGNNDVFWHLEGTIDNLEYPDVFNSTQTITNKVINGQYNSTHDDLYELSNLQFTLTTSSSVVYNITASYFVVPEKVTAERSLQLDDTTSSLINVIPILVIIGILMLAVGTMIYYRR